MMTDEDKEFIATLLTLGADTCVLSKGITSSDTEYYVQKLELQFMHYVDNPTSKWTLYHLPVKNLTGKTNRHGSVQEMKQLLKERINETQSTTGTDT